MYNARHLARSLGSALAGLFGIRVRDTAKLRNAIEFLSLRVMLSQGGAVR